ncbi:LacI family DNA-binding transcriptional regulator [Bifidobacterium sp. ESL0728]|uniref:LacI family DNA-binding transcriptional regulator n=1 Tax=Bifidobacterium sp. ESL0728 TaxID=2983220 RepID=UPI0023F68462|nr:LacI family DNA-binding transcriptional regulator [Bifidobacterium sp. ESL0728]WEV58907.1 LacI family DNA-binding transcriptional regulator [Bifidobacterium sp. ESL0728]
MQANIEDVAKLAGVSIATVSRTFRHPDLVASKTREKVTSAAKELNFSISRSASIFQTGQTYRIALLNNDRSSTWFNAQVYDGLNMVFQPAGYDIAFYQILTSEERDQFFENLPIRRNVDAVVVASINISNDEASRLLSMSVPIAGINAIPEDAFSLSISINDEEATRLITRYLISIGHTDLVFLTFASTETVGTLRFSANLRVQGFKKACKAAGVNPVVIDIRNDEHLVDNALAKLFALDHLPTAICCQQDSLALPLIARLQQFGYRIPEDISITGFDDIDYASQMGLTTVHQDPKEMGSTIAKRILQLLNGEKVSVEHETLDSQIIFRSSTAPPRIATKQQKT